jgi:hypothetical protein
VRLLREGQAPRYEREVPRIGPLVLDLCLQSSTTGRKTRDHGVAAAVCVEASPHEQHALRTRRLEAIAGSWADALGYFVAIGGVGACGAQALGVDDDGLLRTRVVERCAPEEREGTLARFAEFDTRSGVGKAPAYGDYTSVTRGATGGTAPGESRDLGRSFGDGGASHVLQAEHVGGDGRAGGGEWIDPPTACAVAAGKIDRRTGMGGPAPREREFPIGTARNHACSALNRRLRKYDMDRRRR